MQAENTTHGWPQTTFSFLLFLLHLWQRLYLVPKEISGTHCCGISERCPSQPLSGVTPEENLHLSSRFDSAPRVDALAGLALTSPPCFISRLSELHILSLEETRCEQSR